jgi:ubiquitin C-terminal hydrolase
MQDNWAKIKRDASLERKRAFRRIEFVASTAAPLVTAQQPAQNGKSAPTKQHYPNQKQKQNGLFDPTLVQKYVNWTKVSRVGPGFFNDGNTCYLNSTLQCLVHTPAIAQILKCEPKLVLKGLGIAANTSDNRDNRDKDFNQHANRSVLQYFQSLVSEVWSGASSRAISPRAMVASIRRVGKQFKPLRQEDAHEYLRQLLDCMHEEVLKANGVKTSDGKIAETSMISRVFGGYICNTLTCGQCQYASKTYNHFLDLSLDLSQGIKSVAGGIEAFTRPEYLSAGNEWKCEKCKQKVKVSMLAIYTAHWRCGASSCRIITVDAANRCRQRSRWCCTSCPTCW